MTDILVVGDLNYDYLGKVPFFPEADEEVAVNPLESHLGGSGANFSVIAVRLGLSVSFYSAVGNDPGGQSLLNQVRENGVSIQHVKVVEGIATGMVFGVIEPSGVRRLFCFRGANLQLLPQDISDEELSSAGWLHLNGPEYDLALNMLRRARKLKIPTSIDPGSILIEEHDINELLPLTDTLFLNEIEFQKLTEGESYRERAQYLYDKGAQQVVLKHQDSGSVLFRKNQPPLHQNAFTINAVDSTGAGDAFNAGFIYATIKGYELPEVLKFANAIGGLTAMSLGATTGVPHSMADTEAFIKNTPQNTIHLNLQ